MVGRGHCTVNGIGFLFYFMEVCQRQHFIFNQSGNNYISKKLKIMELN